MKKKSTFSHPRQLTLERSKAPTFPDDGDEIFQNGVFFFNVSALLEWLQHNPQPITNVPLDPWCSCKEDGHVQEADLTRPVVLAEIAPDYKDFIPDTLHQDLYGRGYVCMDGHHRMEKARRLGIDTLPAVVLRMEQHIPFLYSGYEQYVSYWNGKLADRTRDSQFTYKL